MRNIPQTVQEMLSHPAEEFEILFKGLSGEWNGSRHFNLRASLLFGRLPISGMALAATLQFGEPAGPGLEPLCSALLKPPSCSQKGYSFGRNL